jgi:hypothetical protein
MHKYLTGKVSSCGHGHGEISWFHWAVFYAGDVIESRGKMFLLPIWVILKIDLIKTIDSFPIGSRIAPNMFNLFALPRSRRPRPTSFPKVGSFLFDDRVNAA